MTTRTVLRAAARDIDNILDYLEIEAGAPTALRYAALFDRQLDFLASYPGSGPRRPALGANTRIAVVSPYVMIYDYDPSNDVVVVLRVIHGRRNVTRKLLPISRND